jgi:nitrous oxidase accessory protein NosD
MKKLAVSIIILLLISTVIAPSAPSMPTPHERRIITVGDEPGDVNYTSIQDALNNASPGDIIEVYSGTYQEQNLVISQNNITLIGISHEPDQGNANGQPFILGDGYSTVLTVKASHVIISNFRVEEMNPQSWCKGVYLGTGIYSLQNNNTVSYMTIANCTDGIVCNVDRGINISRNNISHCSNDGILIGAFYVDDYNILCVNNSITDCMTRGIELEGSHMQIMDNVIRGCPLGLRNYQGESDLITRNNIENCSIGIYLNGGFGNHITQNNFIHYSKDGYWWDHDQWYFILYGPRNIWKNNYWDTWTGRGPYPIRGLKNIRLFILFSFQIKWLDFDWHPAQTPYGIP